jgi:hypothetical protein
MAVPTEGRLKYLRDAVVGLIEEAAAPETLSPEVLGLVGAVEFFLANKQVTGALSIGDVAAALRRLRRKHGFFDERGGKFPWRNYLSFRKLQQA